MPTLRRVRVVVLMCEDRTQKHTDFNQKVCTSVHNCALDARKAMRQDELSVKKNYEICETAARFDEMLSRYTKLGISVGDAINAAMLALTEMPEDERLAYIQRAMTYAIEEYAKKGSKQ